MANYPYTDTKHSIESNITPEEGIDDDFSQPGLQHSRIFYSGYYRFNLIHDLTRAEYNTLWAFYVANTRAAVTLTYFGSSPTYSYTVKFTSPPTIVGNHGLDRHRVEVNLRGYKN